MQIVIDIDDEDYKRIQGISDVFNSLTSRTYSAIKKGTPLPKGCDVQRIIPKRVNVQKWIYTECPNPNCNCELSTHHGDGYYSIEHKPDFCPACGQALLWESEE